MDKEDTKTIEVAVGVPVTITYGKEVYNYLHKSQCTIINIKVKELDNGR